MRHRSVFSMCCCLLLSSGLFLGCSQDSSRTEQPSAAPDSPVGAQEDSQKIVQDLAEQLQLQAVQALAPDVDNPITIQLPPLHYSDSYLLVTLEAEVSTAQGSIRKVRWEQIEGPEAVITDPARATAEVWLPSVEQATILRFRLAAVNTQGVVNYADTRVVVTPVDNQGIRTSKAVSASNARIEVYLAEPAQAPFNINVNLQDLSARAGRDYHLPAPSVAFAEGEQSKIINIELLPDEALSRSTPVHFLVELDGHTTRQRLYSRTIVTLPSAGTVGGGSTYRGISDFSQGQLGESTAFVRVHLSWRGEGGMRLEVTDPCQQQLTLETATVDPVVCQGMAGIYLDQAGSLDLNHQVHQVFWPAGAPAGFYAVTPEYLGDGQVDYDLRVFYGDASEHYTGRAGASPLVVEPIRFHSGTEDDGDPQDGGGGLPGKPSEPDDKPEPDPDADLDLLLPRPSQQNALLALGKNHQLAMSADGVLVVWGDDEGEPTLPDQPVALAAGGAHSLALMPNGDVYAWGDNSHGQTELPDDLTDVVAIAAGNTHSLALLANGTLIAWGDNREGQTHLPPFTGPVIAIAAGDAHNLALLKDGSVVAWGRNSQGQAFVPNTLREVTALAAGGNHSLALSGDGVVTAWGGNDYGQAAVPADLGATRAIAAGAEHSLAILVDGSVVLWGHGSEHPDVVSGLATGVVEIAAGGSRSLARRADGSVAFWDEEGLGQAVPIALQPVEQYPSRKHMQLIALRGAGMDDVQHLSLNQVQGSTGTAMPLPSFVVEESGYAVAMASPRLLTAQSFVTFDIQSLLLDLLSPQVSDGDREGLRLVVAGGPVDPLDEVQGVIGFSPFTGQHSTEGTPVGSLVVSGAHYVAHRSSPVSSPHSTVQTFVRTPENVQSNDLLLLVTMHRQACNEQTCSTQNLAHLSDIGFRQLGFVMSDVPTRPENQVLTVWAKTADFWDPGQIVYLSSHCVGCLLLR